MQQTLYGSCQRDTTLGLGTAGPYCQGDSVSASPLPEPC